MFDIVDMVTSWVFMRKDMEPMCTPALYFYLDGGHHSNRHTNTHYDDCMNFNEVKNNREICLNVFIGNKHTNFWLQIPNFPMWSVEIAMLVAVCA